MLLLLLHNGAEICGEKNPFPLIKTAFVGSFVILVCLSQANVRVSRQRFSSLFWPKASEKKSFQHFSSLQTERKDFESPTISFLSSGGQSTDRKKGNCLFVAPLCYYYNFCTAPTTTTALWLQCIFEWGKRSRRHGVIISSFQH